MPPSDRDRPPRGGRGDSPWGALPPRKDKRERARDDTRPARPRDDDARPPRARDDDPRAARPRRDEAPRDRGRGDARPAFGDRPRHERPSREERPTRDDRPRHDTRPSRDERPRPAREPRVTPPQDEMLDDEFDTASDDGAPRRPRQRDIELRLFGLNACLAVFERRPAAIRKVYLLESRMPRLKAVLAWCARERIGYRLVGEEDLYKLTRSEHHEGVCFEVLRAPPLSVAEWLQGHADRARPALALLLDGVGNPHNFGAVLRSAAHFGVDAVILPPGSSLALSGAACRVAEGGAEQITLVAMSDLVDDLAALERARFEFAATVVREGSDIYAEPMPKRLVLVFGAEGGGVSASLLRRIERQWRIPGSGSVESLNIAAAVAVVLAEFWRQHRR